MEIKKCSRCGEIYEEDSFGYLRIQNGYLRKQKMSGADDLEWKCECGGTLYNNEDYETQEIKTCPECQSPWDIINNRCTANCQVPTTERIL